MGWRGGSAGLRGWLEAWGYLAVLVLLVASIGSYRLIPGWGAPWGLDLQNVWAFHHCASRDDPYAVSGLACGDRLGRPFVYPPLLYWSFTWMRGVSFPAARWIWAAVCVAILLGAAVAWTFARGADGAGASRSVSARAALVGALLAAQFPAVFAIERGNNDVVVLLVWSAAYALFVRGNRLASGGLVGLAIVLKVYPAIAAVVVAAGALGEAMRGKGAERRAMLGFAGALALVPVLATLALFAETRTYLTEVLPRFAAHVPAVTVYSHSVPATLPTPWLWSGALVVGWSWVASRRFRDAPGDVFAGALAVSTFVAATSFDYNLVTAYPLLLVQLARALEEDGDRALRAWAALALGLVAIVAHRELFLSFPAAHVALQLAWLALSAVVLAWDSPRRETRAAVSSPPASA